MLIVAGVAAAEIRIIPQDSGVQVRLRGISAVSADVAWASGREGTVLRTVDGGRHWQAIRVPDAGELDFRDVEGFDADTAVVLSIGPGEASRVYRTEDGGKSWKRTLQNRDPRAFFDCMAFEGERGWMLGDPVESRFQVYATDNGGRDWRLLPVGPKAQEGEAAFAASGTCISRNPAGVLAVVTGGSTSHIWLSDDDGQSWNTLPGATHIARLPSGKSSAGAFSAAPTTDGFLVVGGDFEKESEPAPVISVEAACDGVLSLCPGKELMRAGEVPELPGYRSGVACSPGSSYICVAVGPSGIDLIDQPADSTASISTTGYDAIDLSGNIGWTSGDAGRIARIEITNEAGD